MTFKIADTVYRVWWSYKTSKRGARSTTCNISRNSMPWLSAVAVCAVGDQFIKERGRILSLKYTLTPMSRPIRKLFWDAYWSR